MFLTMANAVSGVNKLEAARLQLVPADRFQASFAHGRTVFFAVSYHRHMNGKRFCPFRLCRSR